MKDNTDRQLELEMESVSLGINRYRQEHLPWNSEDRNAKPEAESFPGQVQLQRLINPMIEGIDAWRDAQAEASQKGGRGRPSKYRLLAEIISPLSSEILAFITCRTVINYISKESQTQEVALAIAQTILDELNYQILEKEAPGLCYVISEQVKQSTKRHAAKVYQHALNTAKLRAVELIVTERCRLGMAMMEILVNTTGVITFITKGTRGGKKVSLMVGTEEVKAWFEKAHNRCELLSPIYLPMLVKPKPWTTPFDGGYLNNAKMPMRLVKTSNREYLNDLTDWYMPEVYRSVNALQDTPWRINTKVLDVMHTVWNSGMSLGGLPQRDGFPLPTKPLDIDTNEEARTKWKRAASKVHYKNRRLVSKRVATAQKLWIADKFRDEDEIYFPHAVDWRGRIYPQPALVNPQSDDLGKGLLEFAKGKALGSDGAWWLAVHIANLFGVDKVSFEERVQWVMDHNFEICMAAVDPIEYQFWAGADKPYQALAACIEWNSYQQEGESFVSHLPIAMDGSNNGVQHFAMMMRDVRSGEAVNLVPADKPQDIYQRVADVVSARVELDLMEGNEFAKEWYGKVDRTICKRPVMTLPYGATQFGMRDQVKDTVKKLQEKGKDYSFEDLGKASSYLANIIYYSIGEVVSAARNAMDWLQALAREVASHDLPARWVTPAGFPVLQDYRRMRMHRIQLKAAGSSFDLMLGAREGKLNKRKQASGISPNVVHSLDAAHLMATVNRCLDAGLEDFAMVHDSYAVHACDVNTMNHHIRAAFVDQYAENRLEELREQIVSRLPEELAQKIPPVPEQGDLNPAVVLNSEYFFA